VRLLEKVCVTSVCLCLEVNLSLFILLRSLSFSESFNDVGKKKIVKRRKGKRKKVDLCTNVLGHMYVHVIILSLTSSFPFFF
jgi:hypothetical protein